MKNNMTREEALEKIEELKSYIETIPEKKPEPEPQHGQVWKYRPDNEYYLMTLVWIQGHRPPQMRLYALNGNVGAAWTDRENPFGDSRSAFKYVGEFKDLYRKIS